MTVLAVQSQTVRLDIAWGAPAAHLGARRHRIDRREHARSRRPRPSVLYRGGVDRRPQRRAPRRACRDASGRACRRCRRDLLRRASRPAERHRHRGRCRRRRAGRSGKPSCRLGDGSDRRRRRPQADARRSAPRHLHRARQQGMPRLGRTHLHARGRPVRDGAAARRLGAFSGDAGHGRWRAGEHRAHLPHGLRRAVPLMEPRRHGERNPEAGARPSQLVDGPEGHHRFRRR